MRGWVVWLVGLPGSGKTARAREFFKELNEKNIETEYLKMDEIRDLLTPKKKYTEEERDHAYRALVLISKFLSAHGINVILDATCHKKVWRELARNIIPRFVEIYVKCPLELCMKRESAREDNLVMKELYRKALERIKDGKEIDGLGEVIGVDVEYEEPKQPDLVIDSEKLTPEESSKEILKFLKFKGWL
jgi:adenylylsulfate kinase